jgi:quercetin dioxygenase-like cupin family protein
MTDKTLPGGDACGLVEYQEGSIVSRTLFKGPNGSATLFAFDASQAISEHTVAFDALALVLDGEAEFQVGGETSRVTQGGLIVMPANVPHAVKAPTKFKMILTMVKQAAS